MIRSGSWVYNPLSGMRLRAYGEEILDEVEGHMIDTLLKLGLA